MVHFTSAVVRGWVVIRAKPATRTKVFWFSFLSRGARKSFYPALNAFYAAARDDLSPLLFSVVSKIVLFNVPDRGSSATPGCWHWVCSQCSQTPVTQKKKVHSVFSE